MRALFAKTFAQATALLTEGLRNPGVSSVRLTHTATRRTSNLYAHGLVARNMIDSCLDGLPRSDIEPPQEQPRSHVYGLSHYVTRRRQCGLLIPHSSTKHWYLAPMAMQGLYLFVNNEQSSPFNKI